jgi:hypothetical protein
MNEVYVISEQVLYEVHTLTVQVYRILYGLLRASYCLSRLIDFHLLQSVQRNTQVTESLYFIHKLR